MSADVIVIIVLCVLGLVAHWARKRSFLEWTLRVIYGFACIAEMYTVLTYRGDSSDATGAWVHAVTLCMGMVTGAMLFIPVRRGISFVLSWINLAVTGQLARVLMRKVELKDAFAKETVFVADSIPHLNGLWIYITTLGVLLANMNWESFKVPSIGIPSPVPIDSLFSYNLLGLVFLAACGCGIFASRKPVEVLNRLGIVKPEGWHVGAAVLCVAGTFLYDYLWSLYTGGGAGNVGSKLAMYNSGTFTAGGAGPAAFLALATAICAGIGEETLMRGGLQPVFGIVPAAILHGVLHGQFNHMPILVIQISVWSMLLGVVRRYTNTTTTIMAHGTYNFLNTFLFAFNP